MNPFDFNNYDDDGEPLDGDRADDKRQPVQ